MRKIMGEDVKGATAGQIKKVLEQGLSKSKTMVALFELGLGVKEIQTTLEQHLGTPVRYNFVYNVVSNHCAINGIAVEKRSNGGTKKDSIIELHNQGKSLKEISIELKTNYNHVHKVVKEYKASQETTEQTE